MFENINRNNNNDHRFSLDRSSKKYVCPKCQHKTFVRYIDKETGESIADNVGKCDRAVNCTYHYPPRQYFADNPKMGNAQQTRRDIPKQMPVPKPIQKPDYIDLCKARETFNRFDDNTLFRYIASVCGEEKTRKAFRSYDVGTMEDGASIFWQFDEGLNIRTGKMIHFKTNGHRDRAVCPILVHKLKQFNDNPNFNRVECLFGAHLIDCNNPIGVVEGEKTAIVASIYLPQYTWVATGGKGNLQPDKFDVMKGKDVVLFPDLGATDDWKKKAEQLRHKCRSLSVSEYLENKIPPDSEDRKDREQGLDIADYMLRKPLIKIDKDADHE